MTANAKHVLDMRMIRAAMLAVAFAASMFVPTSVYASGPAPQQGVHVDPGSPAGKQYQLPVTATRAQLSGGSGRGSRGSQLFGAGIHPSPPASSGPAAASAQPSQPTPTTRATAKSVSKSRPSKARHGIAPARSVLTAAEAPNPAISAASASGNGDGGNGWIPLIIGGVLVLAIGCGGGFLVRRRLIRA